MRIPEHRANSRAAKCRKLIVANQYHTEPLARLARASSSTSRAVPITSPVQSAANAPVPLSLGYSTPSRKHAAIGGAEEPRPHWQENRQVGEKDFMKGKHKRS